MSFSGWLTMLAAWSVITWFTARFLIKVVRTPERDE